MTHRLFASNPVPVNLLLLGLALVIGTALVTYVWRKSRSIHRENIEGEAEDAREVLMPGVVANGGYGALSRD